MKQSVGERRFAVLNSIFLGVLALLCLLPLIHVLAVSLSSKNAVLTGQVSLLPVDLTWEPYSYVLRRVSFWRAFLVSFRRVVLGVSLNVVLTIGAAYPLSKDSGSLLGRTAYAWFFFITMLFNGGLIPGYTLLRDLNLLNTIWALALPGAVSAYFLILMLSFFRQIPIELEEAAYIDGAGYFRTLWRIFVPISVPSIATIVLFSVVNHWNAWFDGLIFMNHVNNYPLQSYLQTVIVGSSSMENSGNWLEIVNLTDRNLKCAQIFVALVPVLLIYPILQRYFVTGLVLGSVKG